MGLILEDVGHIAIELRRESFVIHPGYGYEPKGDEAEGLSAHEKTWRELPHPEFLKRDLDDLIRALQNARDHIARGGKPVQFGVWCIEDGAFCEDTVGSRSHAERELPRWVSGEAADVDPARFHYELREVP